MKLDRLTVGDMMTTALITMRGSEKLNRADVDMKLANIRHIPVVDDKGRCIGMLSNRDVLGAAGETPTSQIKISDIMTTRLFTVREDTPAHEAAETMLEHKIGALPVLGESGQLIGLVTETDFLIVAHRALKEEA